jgi:hypothetical protein
MTVLGRRKVPIWNIGITVKTAFVICNLPACVKNKEVAYNLLSHLETNGKIKVQPLA